MKKNDIYLIIGAALLLIIGFFISKGAEDKKTSEEKMNEWRDIVNAKEVASGLNEMEYNYIEALANVSEEEKIILVSRTTCSWCQKFKPILSEVASEYNIPIIVIEADTEELSNKVQQLYPSAYTGGTPATILAKGKKVIDNIGGYVEKDALIQFFKDNNIIK